MQQQVLFGPSHRELAPFPTQLLKWIGNKQRFAHQIAAVFPDHFVRYFEPFLGSGSVLATLAPTDALGSDSFAPLIEIFHALKYRPEELKEWYAARWEHAHGGTKIEGYEKVRHAFNADPNGADLLFLCRACYGGVVRFRKHDGFMSTPCGAHEPIHPASFSKRVDLWRPRIQRADFEVLDFKCAMRRARRGDLVYCDPPYVHSQSILYGGQSFDFSDLLSEIERCKRVGAYVALSIDGTKKSGRLVCNVPVPAGLFEVEVPVRLGRSMLRRFQLGGETLENEVVADRLLLTYTP